MKFNITFNQIIEYYNAKIFDKTSFSISFKINNNQFAIFFDSENKNNLTLFWIDRLHKIDLLCFFLIVENTWDIEYLKKLNNQIKLIETDKLTFDDHISIDDFLKHIVSLTSIDLDDENDEINLNLFNTNEFKDKIFQHYNTNEYSLPLKLNDEIINFYDFDINSDNAKLRYNNYDGYWSSIKNESNREVFVCFNPLSSIHFFSKVFTSHYLIFIINQHFSIKTIEGIFNKLDKFRLINKNFTLIYHNNIFELFSLIKFLLFYAQKYIPFSFILEHQESFNTIFFRVNISSSKNKIIDFIKSFNNLNSKLINKYKSLLETSPNFNEILPFFNFNFSNYKTDNINFLELKIPYKKEHLIIFYDSLIDFFEFENFILLNSDETDDIDNKNTTL